MTKHSDEGYLVHLKADEHADSDDPLSTDVVRSLRNNLIHEHDMATEVPCNWAAIGASALLVDVIQFDGAEWWPAFVAPLRVIPRLDGAPSDLIVRVAGKRNTDAASVRVNVVPMGAPIVLEPSSLYGTASASLTASVTWAIDSQFTFATESQAHRELGIREDSGGALVTTPTWANSGGTDEASVSIPMWRVDVWTLSVDDSDLPELHGVFVRQFIGA